MKALLRVVILATFVAGLSEVASAALISRQVDNDPTASGFFDDGVVSVGEYSTLYSNGGGTGFGNAVGGGAIYMDSDATNLYIGFDPGGDLNDLAILYLDTRTGGVLDSQMNDRADGGRNGASNITSEADDLFPIGADFAVVFGSFGTVVFELTTHAGDELISTPNHLNFLIFQGDQNTNDPAIVRELAIELSDLGNPGRVDFFVAYTAESGFNSSESLPFSTALNAGGNPGFNNGGNGPVSYDNFNRYVVPEPSTLLITLFGLAAAGAGCRYRQR